MIELEDLPRMQSLSPVMDFEAPDPSVTQLNPKKVIKPMPKLLIKPTVASTPAKLPTTLTTPTTPKPTTPTPTTTIIPITPTTPKSSEEMKKIERNMLYCGFNFNTLISIHQMLKNLACNNSQLTDHLSNNSKLAAQLSANSTI
ncbi:GH21427 [Drosophila grimshawi]|uniref:GH21427 n=1 Tax=Drosophila grimshawi TaxID=7222 RepID=B4JRT5_DROGR|nr:GH21427 [Drosophila grimshawi]